MTAERKYKIIANPRAGRGRAQAVIRETIGHLQSRGIGYDLEVTTGPNDATAIAGRACASGAFRAILSVGGDGTLNEIAQAALFTGMPVGVIPAGSGNDFVKTLNMPKKLPAILESILAGKTRDIDAGRMNKRYFVNNVGIGFDAAVNYATRDVTVVKAGLAVYLIAFLKTLNRYKPCPMTIRMGGESIERKLFLMSVGNGTTCGGGFRLTPHAKIDDGLLDVTMVTPLSLPRLLWHLPKVFIGTIDKTRHATTRRVTRLTVHSPHPLPLHIDGEVYALEGNTCEIEIVPKAFTVIGNF